VPGVSAIGANAMEKFPAKVARGMRQLCILGFRKVLSEGANDCRGGLECLQPQKREGQRGSRKWQQVVASE
jgi:hypothetical protein